MGSGRASDEFAAVEGKHDDGWNDKEPPATPNSSFTLSEPVLLFNLEVSRSHLPRC